MISNKAVKQNFTVTYTEIFHVLVFQGPQDVYSPFLKLILADQFNSYQSRMLKQCAFID